MASQAAKQVPAKISSFRWVKPDVRCGGVVGGAGRVVEAGAVRQPALPLARQGRPAGRAGPP